MTENKIYNYNPDGTNIGLEAKYMLRDGTLYVKIGGSNHWTDYMVHFLTAWPRVKHGDRKYHRGWYNWAAQLYDEVDDGSFTRVEMMAYSMGGPVIAILAIRFRRHRMPMKITTINAPKFGNKAAVWALLTCGADIHCLYDSGDVVRHLPPGYANYPLRSRRSYGHTRGIRKAHVNFPPEWGEFAI